MFVLLNGGKTPPSSSQTKSVSLADVCVTEWRLTLCYKTLILIQLFHSLMFVLLNGGSAPAKMPAAPWAVSLADVCVTEWRRKPSAMLEPLFLRFHSLMFVLLNGGSGLEKDLKKALAGFTR